MYYAIAFPRTLIGERPMKPINTTKHIQNGSPFPVIQHLNLGVTIHTEMPNDEGPTDVVSRLLSLAALSVNFDGPSR